MRILPFNDWIDQQMAVADKDQLVDCPNCLQWWASGTCDRCDGDGQVPIGTLGQYEQLQVFDLNRYIEAVAADVLALAKWQGAPVEALLFDLQMAPWSRLSDKTVHANMPPVHS